MRPVDLARAAGISAQQVRNHLAEGVLPPAERTPSGHRRFGEHHLAALLAFRALGRACGWDTARAVMHAVHDDDLSRGLALLDAAHADLHVQRLDLDRTAEALESFVEVAESVPRGGLRVGDLAARLGVRPSALRVWETAGLLHPARDRDGHRRYSAADVRDARLVLVLRRSRHGLSDIAPIMDRFRAAGGREALRAAVTARRSEVADRSRAMLDAAVLLHACVRG
ncbi:MerR family transcriptional regulator [Saccharothrix violaceirubra]|uniref:DNA-binding transcriptional MerR regulator n=1 Tax=Saccharothrix violaceirubra TaxID=413306 RepID=A0A7W7T1H6_9PSEU|nr:MerR family transcriptional regulator [Saccharothrix violaceirubra]MBB4964837.1 DNA-binding transcriptional MerR regulator [Saccharothrix violaceirubra]